MKRSATIAVVTTSHARCARAGVAGALFLLALLAVPLPVSGVESSSPRAEIPKVLKGDLKPVPESEQATIHPPYQARDCSLCHERSDAADPGRVTTAGNALCFECHDDYPDVLARKFGHVPATESCITCHNPHNSRERRLLRQPLKDLCFSCHTDIQMLAEKSRVQHGALASEAKCMACHNPHGANVEHLLRQMPRELCLQCHNREDVTDHEGRKLTNMQRLFDQNPQHHGALRFGDCSACHNPHGFEHFRLLNEEYPPDFYSQYDPKLYALCFECHETSAFTEPATTVLTQFRDGSRNLHYLHVNKEEMGRTCRACHEVHASKLPHLIRASVPYGDSGWMLKVNFTTTPTGGSCNKTCHGEMSYNNTAPVPAIGSSTTAQPPRSPVAHTALGSQLSDLELVSLDGTPVSLLDPDVATVVVFFKPGQEHSRVALQQIAPLMDEFAAKPVRWVGVASDRFSREAVLDEAARPGVTLPVLLDTGDRAYGALGVAQEPAFGFIEPGRRFAAFQAFAKVNLSEVLRARVRRMLGEITDAELDETLHPPPLPVWGAAAAAHTRFRLAERLFREGHNHLALAGVKVSLEENPNSAAAHVLHGNILNATGQKPEARKAFETALQLDPNNMAARLGLDALSAADKKP